MPQTAVWNPASAKSAAPRKKPAPLTAFFDPVSAATQRNSPPSVVGASSFTADFDDSTDGQITGFENLVIDASGLNISLDNQSESMNLTANGATTISVSATTAAVRDSSSVASTSSARCPAAACR